MELMQLIAPWRLSGPVTFRQIETGYINAIYAVESPSGRFVLRVYREPGDLSHIHQEHRVTAWLQHAGHSFAVPAPIPAAGGETLAVVGGPEDPVYVALIPFLPGAHPDFRRLPLAEAAGGALGELVTALGGIELDAALAAIPRYGDLDRVHPDISDPFAAVGWLPVEPDWHARIRRVLAATLQQIPALYAQLPQQIIHGDLTHGNVLMVEDRVVGVLDFEFSAWDLRAMDYAVGIGGGPKSLRNGWGDWPVLEAFSRGYFRRHRLTEAELEALADLIRLRRINILLRFAGRFRQGLDQADVSEGMAWWTLDAEEWLAANGAELVRRAKEWARQAR